MGVGQAGSRPCTPDILLVRFLSPLSSLAGVVSLLCGPGDRLRVAMCVGGAGRGRLQRAMPALGVLLEHYLEEGAKASEQRQVLPWGGQSRARQEEEAPVVSVPVCLSVRPMPSPPGPVCLSSVFFPHRFLPSFSLRSSLVFPHPAPLLSVQSSEASPNALPCGHLAVLALDPWLGA